MNSNDTTIIQKTKDKIAIGAKELALIVALSVALYFPGRLIVAWGHDAIDWLKLTAREGLADVVAWDLGHFEIAIDTKGRQLIGADTRSNAELQGILYRVLIDNQTRQRTIDEVRDQVIGLSIALDIDNNISSPSENTSQNSLR